MKLQSDIKNPQQQSCDRCSKDREASEKSESCKSMLYCIENNMDMGVAGQDLEELLNAS